MTVSHELRTPLTAIYGWARMLSTGQIRDAQRPRAIEAIERNAGALQQLVNDLLDVSRVVSGRLRLDVQPVAMPDVVGAAIDAIRPAAHARKIRVDDHGRWRRSDGDRRRRAAAAGDVEPAVERGPLHADRRPDRRSASPDAAPRSTIVVRDTGPGIDAAFLPHVFERFRQGAAGTTRAHGGLGLGLAIVRHLVELHGGTVEVTNNTPAPGATFRSRCRRGRPRVDSIRRSRRRRRRARRAAPYASRRRPRAGHRRRHERARDAGGDPGERRRGSPRRMRQSEDALMILETWTARRAAVGHRDAGGRRLPADANGSAAWRRRATAWSPWPSPRTRGPTIARAPRPPASTRHLAKPIDPAELLVGAGEPRTAKRARRSADRRAH